MSSVTSRAKEVKQPKGGYLKPSSFLKTTIDDGITLEESENIHASVIGMVVDYMTRVALGEDIKQAFRISLKGYYLRIGILSSHISDQNVKESGILKERKNLSIQDAKPFLVASLDGENAAYLLLKQIQGLDDQSIIAACKIVTYDVWFRNPMEAMYAKAAKDINPDKKTIHNIRTMIQRSLLFWKKVGPIIANGFTFAEMNRHGDTIKSGYTSTVTSGDGDYLTKDAMWDFKVSKSAPTNKHTLQLLMYYIMGKHSNMDIYTGIEKLGFFNPRLNTMYVLNVADISEETIHAVETDVICY